MNRSWRGWASVWERHGFLKVPSAPGSGGNPAGLPGGQEPGAEGAGTEPGVGLTFQSPQSCGSAPLLPPTCMGCVVGCGSPQPTITVEWDGRTGRAGWAGPRRSGCQGPPPSLSRSRSIGPTCSSSAGSGPWRSRGLQPGARPPGGCGASGPGRPGEEGGPSPPAGRAPQPARPAAGPPLAHPHTSRRLSVDLNVIF